jgi:hypothetical protein
MRTEDFNKVIDDTINICKKTLIKKQGEYNLDEDRLSFFKEGNELTKLSPERTLYLFMYKHIKSLADMVASEKSFPRQLWTDKIIDNINYLLLLWALINDDKLIDEENQ